MKSATLLPIALLVISCGGGAGSAPPAEAPPATPQEPAAVDIAEPPAVAASAAAPAPAPAAASATPATPHPNPAKIEFPPHPPVEQAITAIPQGKTRLNMSNDLPHATLLDLQRHNQR